MSGIRRWAAAGGVAYVVLQMVAQALIQVGGAEPPFSAPAETALAFFEARNPTLCTAGAYVHVVSMAVFVWFLGALWATLREAEGEPAWLSAVAAGSGALAAVVSLASFGWGLAFFRVQEGISPEMARFLFDLGNFGFANYWVMLANLLGATGILALRTGVLPRWIGWLGVVTAVGLLVARAFWAASPAVMFPYVLVWIWLIATSVVLFRRAGR